MNHNHANFAAYIPFCHHCLNRQQECDGGMCTCTIDGKDIADHANEGYCPIGNFRIGLGDFLARLFHRTGVKAVVNTVTGGNCGCKKRQMDWNRTVEV